jgi:hypothetical protein
MAVSCGAIYHTDLTRQTFLMRHYRVGRSIIHRIIHARGDDQDESP